MTSEQTEELAALKAALKQHIDEAEKATPEPWEWVDSTDDDWGGDIEDLWIKSKNGMFQCLNANDCAFIARARTMSPLACRIALAGIESFEAAHNYAISQGWPSMTEDDLLKLLTIWKGGKP